MHKKITSHQFWLGLLLFSAVLLIFADNFPKTKQKNNPQKDNSSKLPKETLPPEPSLRNSGYDTDFQGFKQTVERQAKRFPTIFFMQANQATQPRKIALTFDDGPDTTYTEPILDTLKKYEIPATFFLVGFKLERHPKVAQRIVAEGHEIGNHSYSHLNFTKLLQEKEWHQGQVLRFQALSLKLLGIAPKFIRPPYGQIRNEQIESLGKKGYFIVNWSIDTYDWNDNKNSAIQITERVLDYAHNGAIILLHSGGQNRENTLAALPLIIETLEAKGYKFVKISELIQQKPYFQK